MNEESLNNFIDSIDEYESLSFAIQIKLLVYFLQINEKYEEVKSSDILSSYSLLDLKPPQNISDVLIKLSNTDILIKRNKGYVLTRRVRKELDEEFGKNPIVKDINENLRLLLPKIKNLDNKEFLKEAIDCLEIKAFRSAIIMTWLMIIHNLYEYVYVNKLADFNQELLKKGLKIQSINKVEDFSELKESTFIELMRAALIITNDQRKILDEKIGIRNTCAHPNNITIKEPKAINFIDDLIENIYLKFN